MIIYHLSRENHFVRAMIIFDDDVLENIRKNNLCHRMKVDFCKWFRNELSPETRGKHSFYTRFIPDGISVFDYCQISRSTWESEK